MIIDTHAHIHHRQFADDADEVMRRAFEAGVERVVLIGTDAEDTRRALALARRHPGQAFVAAGVHPHDADQWGASEEQALREEFAPDPQVIAIGEMGLDYYYKDKCDRANERRAFVDQLRLARELDYPIVIHCREAYADVLAVLRDELGPGVDPAAGGAVRGVMHCWAGDGAQAMATRDLGFVLGIGGAVTFPRSSELREICAATGFGGLVLETDAPYITPVPHRGKRNEPGYLTHVVACLAEVLRTDEATVRQETTATARRLYPRMA